MGVAAYLYIYQFVFKANVLDLFYYFSYCLPALFLALPYVFEDLWSGIHQGDRRWLPGLAITGFVAPWLSKVYVWDWTSKIHMEQFVGAALGAGILLFVGVRTRMHRNLRMAVVSLCTLSLGVAFDFAFAAGTYDSMFRARRDATLHQRTEEDVYRVSELLMAAVPPYANRPGAVRFWYNNRAGNYANSLQSTYLWDYSRIQQSSPDNPGMPYIGPSELKMFLDQTVKYVVLLGETRDEAARGIAALEEHQIAFERLEARILASGDYRIFLETVQLTGH